MSVYGYCRISTPQQSITRQIRNIKAEYPKAIILEEAFTGTKMNRPKWISCMQRWTPEILSYLTLYRE